ncbi:MAG: ROK family transcriptional regulator [Anaerolineales bacterium]|nr:ROK family transcriptional regulator [Anaerolineales bacterium]
MKIAADQTSLRTFNLSLVARLIHSQAPLSRAQLAAMTNLNKSTISSLADELIERGLICETGNNFGGTGRPAILLEVNPNAGFVVGVEFGVDFIAAATTDILGNVVWRKHEAARVAGDQEQTIAQTLEIVKEAVAESRRKKRKVLGLGISTPGTVDIQKGSLVFAPNLHWRDVPFAQIFSEQTKLKVFVENDANAAAIGERLFGSARRVKDFLFVFAGVGIGGGLFLDGKLYRGKNGYAGEIGHSPIMSEPSQNLCHCGNRGCWETYANQYSIIQRIQARLEVKRASVIPQLMAEQNAALDIPLIKQAADLGDREALDSFHEAGQAMGQGLAGLINIFNPEKIVIGGPLSVAGEYMLPAIKKTISQYAMPGIKAQATINLSPFGADAAVIGAIAVVVDDLLALK